MLSIQTIRSRLRPALFIGLLLLSLLSTGCQEMLRDQRLRVAGNDEDAYVTGCKTSKNLGSDEVILSYTYTYGGQEYDGSGLFHRCLVDGDQVEVLVDASSPTVSTTKYQAKDNTLVIIILLTPLAIMFLLMRKPNKSESPFGATSDGSQNNS